jgi:hypothetical protein
MTVIVVYLAATLVLVSLVAVVAWQGRSTRSAPRSSQATACDVTGHTYPAVGYAENCRRCGHRGVDHPVYDQEQDGAA